MRAKKLSAGSRGHFMARMAFLFGVWGILLVTTGVFPAHAQVAAQLLSARSTAVPLPSGGNGDSVDPQISPDGRFVLFNSTAANLVSNTAGQLCSQVFLRDRSNNTTTLVSVNRNGFGGNGHSIYGGMTPDGRYVAFSSDASDLGAGDTNGWRDIFVRDLVAGTTVLVSQSTNGGAANADSSFPAITPDGRFVAFLSAASNLTPNDSNGIQDVFVRDLVLQTNILATLGATNSLPNTLYPMYISPPQISTNGRYVAFWSTEGGLVPAVTNFAGEVYISDLTAGQIIWASTNAANLAQSILAITNATSYHPVLSDDGAVVVFKTGATNGIGPALISQYNLTNQSSIVISANGLSVPIYGDDPYGPEMTADGRCIAFVSSASGTNLSGSMNLYDTQAAASFLVSTNLAGAVSSNTIAESPVISADGRYVMFLGNDGNLTANAVSNGMHIFRWDRQTGIIALIDADTNGVGSTDFTGTLLSGSTNGQFIAFCGPDGALAPSDFNGLNDVFLRDATGGTTQLISQRNPSVSIRSGDKYSSEGTLSISADGRWVAFTSYANDLVANDTNNARDVFVCDRWSGSNILASVAAGGGCALGGDSMSPVISSNGQYVVFCSAATNLVAGITITNPGTYNVYRRDLLAQTTIMITVSTNGTMSASGTSTIPGDSTQPVISQDGQYVAFLSRASNLAKGLAGGGPYTFWANNNYDRWTTDLLDPGTYEDDVATNSSAANSLYTGLPVPDYEYRDANGHRIIPCPRDLEDYARIWVSGISTNVLANLPSGSTVTLSWAGIGTSPTIDLFQAADTNGGIGYLTNLTTASNQINTNLCQYVGRLGPGGSIQLNASTFSNGWAGDHFIWCGVWFGSDQLNLTISNTTDGTVLAQSSQYIQIQDIKQMYERWTVGDNDDNNPLPTVAPMSNAVPAEDDFSPGCPTQPFQYSYDPAYDTNDTYILYVHGWNEPRWRKDRWAETAFKRLYWQGYQGRFGEFRWPCYNLEIPDPGGYDTSEWNAWKSGQSLETFLANTLNKNYPSNVYVLAHSQGNVVVGEALRLATNQIVNTYVASQGAVSARGYDNTLPTNAAAYYTITTSDPQGHYYTNGAPSYFSASAGAGKYVNFFNPNDYALMGDSINPLAFHPGWLEDQSLKPDTAEFYRYMTPTVSVPSGYYIQASVYNRTGSPSTIYPLYFPTNTYQIFAMGAQSYSLALGAQTGVNGSFLSHQVNLSASPYNFGSAHIQHDAEFVSDNMTTTSYWQQLLTSFALQPTP